MPLHQEIRCIVFDFAFTLCSDFYFKATPPECPDWFYQFQRRIFCTQSPYLDDWAVGRITSRDIAQVMTQHIPMPVDQILRNMEAGCRNLELNPSVVRFAQSQKKAGRKTALVTINYDIFSKVVVLAHGLDDLFDVIVSSADHGEQRKERLWPVAFDQLGSDIGFQNSFLVDDVLSNVDSFRNLGGSAYLYKTDREFDEWLKTQPSLGGRSI